MQHRGTDLILAKKLLTKGKLVAIPTETVYGLAANGLDEIAVAGIFSAKNRPTFDPLILHVASIEQAQSLCTDWPEMAAGREDSRVFSPKTYSINEFPFISPNLK